MLNQKQENFQENASTKQDEINNFLRKKNEQVEGKKSAAEGGRFFFDPFFNQNRIKMKKIQLFCPKRRIKPKFFKKKKQLQTMVIDRKKYTHPEHPILAILVNFQHKKITYALGGKLKKKIGRRRRPKNF